MCRKKGFKKGNSFCSYNNRTRGFIYLSYKVPRNVNCILVLGFLIKINFNKRQPASQPVSQSVSQSAQESKRKSNEIEER